MTLPRQLHPPPGSSSHPTLVDVCVRPTDQEAADVTCTPAPPRYTVGGHVVVVVVVRDEHTVVVRYSHVVVVRDENVR